MKKVKCISPHGGSHYGMRHDGTPVHALPDGTVPAVDPEKLRLQPHEGGWIHNAQLGYCAAGEVYDAPDDFAADGFHFEDVKAPPASPAPPVKPVEPVEGE